MQLETPNYLFFEANFGDGTQMVQDKSDVSSFDSSKSRFYLDIGAIITYLNYSIGLRANKINSEFVQGIMKIR